MKKYRVILPLILCMALSGTLLYGCGERDDAETGDDSAAPKDPYEDYIHEALEAVKDNAQIIDGEGASDSNEQTTEDNGNAHVVEIDRSDDSDETAPVYVSSEVADPADETKGQKDGDSPTSDTKEKTPAVFEVGTGLVYIDGKYDETYRTNLLQTINDARTGLNYPAMTINNSLNTCANLRAKEITCYLRHQRPDGSMFYSLAPDYYKAEIITIDSANPKETLDAWLLDPVSRNLIFSKDFTSIGASNYVCNGLNCIVVSFGY